MHRAGQMGHFSNSWKDVKATQGLSIPQGFRAKEKLFILFSVIKLVQPKEAIEIWGTQLDI